MHKIKLSITADTNHQDQIGNIDYKMMKVIRFSPLNLFTIDSP